MTGKPRRAVLTAMLVALPFIGYAGGTLVSGDHAATVAPSASVEVAAARTELHKSTYWPAAQRQKGSNHLWLTDVHLAAAQAALSPTTTASTTTAPAASCFASPASCGYPDPAAGTVGAPSSDLTASGPLVLSTPGQVIDRLDVTGAVQVQASNVTIQNTRITSSGASGAFAVRIGQGVTGTKILATTIRGKGTSEPDSIEAAVWNGYGGALTIDRSWFYRCADCLEGGASITDSYMVVDGLYSGAHYEDIYINNGAVTVNHSVLLNPQPQTATVFGDVNLGAGGTGLNRMVVTNSLIAGGGFMFYPDSGSTSVGSAVTNVVGNRFARCLTAGVYNSSTGGTACSGGQDSHGYWPNGGYFGVEAWKWCDANLNQIWSGNVWDDNGAEVKC